jgi:hypothetical protein
VRFSLAPKIAENTPTLKTAGILMGQDRFPHLPRQGKPVLAPITAFVLRNAFAL